MKVGLFEISLGLLHSFLNLPDDVKVVAVTTTGPGMAGVIVEGEGLPKESDKAVEYRPIVHRIGEPPGDTLVWEWKE